MDFPLLSDMSAKVIREYGLENTVNIQGVPMVTARRATFLVDKQGKILETSVDKTAIDPSNIVFACERQAKK